MSKSLFNLIDLRNIKPYPYQIKIEGNCTITNYKGKKSSVQNPFTIKQVDNKMEVEGLVEQSYKDLHSSLEALSKIAGMDGNGENLTVEDLKLARQDFGLNRDVWDNMGVTYFGYDTQETVARLEIDGKTLRIDFDKTKNQTKTNTNNVKQAEKTTATKPANKTSAKTGTQNTKQTAKIPDKYAGMRKEWIPYIKSTAKKYGYSEELIISKIIYEGFTPVAVHKNEGGKGGLNEVGFGHTTNANHNNKFKPGFKISTAQAFDWLGQDIKDKEAKIKEFGNYYNYNNIPQPLKEMMIDVAFNRGEGKLNPNLMLTEEEKKKGKKQIFDENYKSVIANIKNEYWGSAAVRLRQEVFPKRIIQQGKEPGLRKRNVQRFLRLMDYLTPEKVVGAMDLFNREYYYTKTLSMLKQPEADSLRVQWNNIYYNAKAKCAKQ